MLFLLIEKEDVTRGEESEAELRKRIAQNRENLCIGTFNRNMDFFPISDNQWANCGKIILFEKSLRLEEIQYLAVEWWVDEF